MKTKQKLHYLMPVILAVIISVVMLAPFWINGLPLEYGGDLKPTYFPYYTEFRSLIVQMVKNRTFPFYSWNIFLGNNFWASKSFYLLGDIYYYLSLLINKHFYRIFEIQTIVKLAVSALTMYIYLYYIKANKKAALTLSLAYAFSSWGMFFLGQPMFMSAFSFVPLYFYGVEKYLKEDRITPFLLSTTLLLFTNYYMFFSLSFFTPFYYSVRYYAIEKGFKRFIGRTLKLIGVYFAGVAVTMIMILPSALYIVQNDRVGTFYLSFLFDQPAVYLHQLQALFVPSHNIVYHNEYNLFETPSHVTRELVLWAGSITAVLIPQFLTDEDKYYRRGMSVLYLLMILTLIIPSGNMMIVGFSSPSFRWTFLFILVNLFNAMRYLSEPSKINRKNLLISLVIIGLILLVNIPLGTVILGKLDSYKDYAILFGLNMLSLLVIGVMAFLVISKHKWALQAVLILTVIQLIFHSTWLIGYRKFVIAPTWDFIYRATHVLQQNPNDLNKYLAGLDDKNYEQFYRTYVPHDSLYWAYSFNHNLHYQLKGLMTYDSTYAPSFNDMKALVPSVKAFDSDWIFNITQGELIDFLSTKYAIVLREEELPHDNFKLVDDMYQGGLLVYENLNYTSVGEVYTDLITMDALLRLDESERLGYFTSHVIVHAEDEDEIRNLLGSEKASLGHIDYHNNYFYGDITVQEPGFMVLKVPYDEGWDIRINGKSVESYKVNGGFIGIALEEGYNELSMNFVPSGFKAGAVISAAGLAISAGLIIWDWKGKGRKDENQR